MESDEIIANATKTAKELAAKGNKIKVKRVLTPKVVEDKTVDLSNTNGVILAIFGTLTPDEQVKIIQDSLLGKKHTHSASVEAKKADLELKEQKSQFNIKRATAIATVIVVISAILAVMGIFVYAVLKNGALSDTGVISGLFKTLTEVLKIMWSTPT